MSTKKEKVALQRGDDFDFVDAELTAALAELDQANKNVAQVLDGDEDEEGDEITVEEKSVASAQTSKVPKKYLDMTHEQLLEAIVELEKCTCL